jgi:hypothetical protein
MQTFSVLDWNFSAVPDDELVACCFWEYARESAFLHKLRQRCLQDQRAIGPRDKKLHFDLQKVQAIGYAANFFLRGFFCPPDDVPPEAPSPPPGAVPPLTGSFPKPWQMLAATERKYRAVGPPRELDDPVLRTPFTRGLAYSAQEIVKTMDRQRRLQDHENESVRRAHPQLTEDALIRAGKLQLQPLIPSVIYGIGTEYTVVEISWEMFSNDEIIKSVRDWVKANRPADIPAPDSKGRNKARDRRVALERLGILRLLHRVRLGEMAAACPLAWKLYQKREWYKDRKRAGEMFHQLFPFLARSARPLSWTTKGGHSM